MYNSFQSLTALKIQKSMGNLWALTTPRMMMIILHSQNLTNAATKPTGKMQLTGDYQKMWDTQSMWPKWKASTQNFGTDFRLLTTKSLFIEAFSIQECLLTKKHSLRKRDRPLRKSSKRKGSNLKLRWRWWTKTSKGSWKARKLYYLKTHYCWRQQSSLHKKRIIIKESLLWKWLLEWEKDNPPKNWLLVTFEDPEECPKGQCHSILEDLSAGSPARMPRLSKPLQQTIAKLE